MNKKDAEKIVNERINYEKENGIDKIPNEILDNYSKQDIRRCITHMMFKHKQLKNVNVKEYMLQWLEKNAKKDWREKLIKGEEKDGRRN